MSTRVITVVATKNGRITKFSENVEIQTVTITSAGNADRTVNNSDPINTWGALRSLLSNEGYDLENLKPTENINKTTLEHIDAVLPVGDFRLFLRPSKTKSGGFDVVGKGFKELRALVTTEEVKSYLSGLVEGKNWTQLSTETLREGLANFNNSTTNSSEAVVTEILTEVTEEVVSNVSNKQKAEQAKELLQSIYDTTTCDEVEKRVENLLDEMDGLISELEDCEDEVEDNSPESEEKRLARIEKEEIKRELRDLEQGF